jgi:hypothetical protein
MILNGTRPANHHRLLAAGDCADQPRTRVFERHTVGLQIIGRRLDDPAVLRAAGAYMRPPRHGETGGPPCSPRWARKTASRRALIQGNPRTIAVAGKRRPKSAYRALRRARPLPMCCSPYRRFCISNPGAVITGQRRADHLIWTQPLPSA